MMIRCLGYIRFGPVENLVSFVVKLIRFDVPFSKRNGMYVIIIKIISLIIHFSDKSRK